jgi:hypothetical protein
MCFGEKHTHSFGTLDRCSILKIDEEQILWSQMVQVNHELGALMGRLARIAAT